MQEPHPAVTDIYVLSKVSLLLKASQYLLLAYLVYYSCTKPFKGVFLRFLGRHSKLLYITRVVLWGFWFPQVCVEDLVCCVVAGLLKPDVTLKYWHSLTVEDEGIVFVWSTGNSNPPNQCNNPEETQFLQNYILTPCFQAVPYFRHCQLTQLGHRMLSCMLHWQKHYFCEVPVFKIWQIMSSCGFNILVCIKMKICISPF